MTLVVVLMAVYVAMTFGLVDARITNIVGNHLMTLLPALAATIAFAVAHRRSGRDRVGWLLIGAWGILSASGNAVFEYYEFIAHQTVPFPSLADVGYLGGNLCAIAAIVAFAVRSRSASTWRMILDATLIAASVFAVSWAFVIGDFKATGSDSVGTVALGLAYPLVDVILVSLIAFVGSQGRFRSRIPLMLIGIGLLGWAFSDTIFAYLTLAGTYSSGSVVDVGWIAGDALIALAAFYGLRTRVVIEPEVVERSAPRWRRHLPYVLCAAAVVAGTADQLIEKRANVVMLSTLMGVLVLVVARQFLMVLENTSAVISHMRALDDMKNAILRAVSHELRTPLTVIKGGTLLLVDGGDELPFEMRQEVLVGMSRNCDRLEGFLVGLLDLERLTRGVLEPARRPTEVRALLKRASDAVAPDDHRIAIVGEEINADIDPGQVERIAENLIVNAVRHTPKETFIRAQVERTPDGILITVEDDGPGIPDGMKKDIFIPFTQAEPGETGNGTGIGLALVSKFAELHGGRAWVEDAESGGARFCVLLSDTPIDVLELQEPPVSRIIHDDLKPLPVA